MIRKLMCLIIIVIVILSSCKWSHNEYYVKYEVTGNVSVNVTVSNEEAQSSKFNDVSTPWSYEMQRYGWVMLRAGGTSIGKITATVYYKSNFDDEWQIYESITSECDDELPFVIVQGML